MKKFFWTALLAVCVSGQMAQARDGWWGNGRGPAPYFSTHYIPHGRVTPVLPYGFISLFVGGMEYFYWEGMYYRATTGGYVVVPAPVGAVVTAIPPGYQHVVIDGVAYYIINGVTYMQTTYGYYQVVPPPRLIVSNNPALTIPTSSAPSHVPMPNPPPSPAIPAPGQRPVASYPVTNVPGTQTAPATKADDSFTVNIPHAKGGYVAVILKRSGNGFVGPQGEYYPEFPKIEILKVMYGK